MYLDVSLTDTPPPPVLRDVDDFRAFKVVIHGDGRLAEAIEGIGRVAGRDAYLDIDAVKRLAGEKASDPAWLQQFDAMVEYARSKGWVDGAALRAHCEQAP
jgi:hypothetical protein